MKTVVSSISYESLWGHDGTWAKYHTTTQVPDETDLSYKADKTDLVQIKNQLQSQLNDENLKLIVIEDKLVEVVERQDQFVDKTTLNQLKSDLVGAERLNREKDFVMSIGDEVIDRIRKQCEIERSAIHNEVVAFREIDINKDLQQRLEPMSVTLNQLVALVKSIQSQLDELGQTKEEIMSVHKRIVQTHSEIIAAKEEIDNRLKRVQNCEEYVDAILNKVQEDGQQVQENRHLCEIACESIEETKNHIAQRVKQMEEYETQLTKQSGDLLKQMTNTYGKINNTAVQVNKRKDEIESLYIRLEEICQHNEKTKGCIEEQTKRVEEQVSLQMSQSQEVLTKMQALSDNVQSVETQIQKGKEEFNLALGDASQVLDQAKDLITEHIEKNKSFQSDINQTMVVVNDKIEHLNNKTKECNIKCVEITDTAQNMLGQLKLSHDDSLRQMQALTDELKSIEVKIQKEKDAFDISCKESSVILNNAKELFSDNYEKNLLVQSSIEKSMSDVKDKIVHLDVKVKECDDLCVEIVGTAQHLQPQMENIKKIKDEMIDFHHQSTSTINTMVSDIKTLSDYQKVYYNKMRQQQKEQNEMFIDQLQVKTEETAREAAVSKIRSMSFGEKVKWMFSGRNN